MRGVSAHVAICAAGSMCSKRGARCAPVNRKPSPLVRVGVGVVIARPVSGSRKPGAWRSCVRDSPSRRQALAAGRPSLTVGGKRLWRNRTHLDEAGMTEQQWRTRWDAARMFLTADGESGKAGGNETIRVDEAGRLRIKVPAALAAQHGTHVRIAAPVTFPHRSQQWAARVAARRAVRYDITYDPANDRWYLDASWKQDAVTAAPCDRRAAHRPGVGCRSQRRSPGLLCAGRIRQPGRGPDHDPRRHRRSAPHRGVMGGSARRSPPCSMPRPTPGALRWSSRTSTSPMPALPAGTRWAAAPGGNGSAAPWPASPPRASGPASRRWRPAAASRSSASMRPTPADGAPNTGVNPCNNRLPNRSPAITARRPRSADVASD